MPGAGITHIPGKVYILNATKLYFESVFFRNRFTIQFFIFFIEECCKFLIYSVNIGFLNDLK